MKVETKTVRPGKRRERGSTLIEFTLTFLPLLALLMMTFDTIWMFFASASIQEGVREGVRYAITMQSDANIKARVVQYSFGFAKTSNVQINYYSQTAPITALSGATSNASGNIVKVVVSGVSITPIGAIWRSKSALSLSASSADIVEPNPNPISRY